MRSFRMGMWGALAAGAMLACGGCGATGNEADDTTGAGGNGGTTDPTGGGGGGGSVEPTAGSYQPLVVGSTWTYQINDKGVPYSKHSMLTAEEAAGIKMVEALPAETQVTWYRRQDNLVVRVEERELDSTMVEKAKEVYNPFRLRVDESPDHTAAGATWTTSYQMTRMTKTKPEATTTVNETWRVDAVDEPTTVPAGTFPALKLTHTDPTDSSTKVYWFARGIGKIREQTSGGHVEELESYTIPQ